MEHDNENRVQAETNQVQSYRDIANKIYTLTHTNTAKERFIHTCTNAVQCAMHSFDIRVNVWLVVSYIKLLIFDAFLQYAHQLMLLQYCTTTIDAFLLHSWCNSEYNIKWIFTLKSIYDRFFVSALFLCTQKKHKDLDQDDQK